LNSVRILELLRMDISLHIALFHHLRLRSEVPNSKELFFHEV